MPKLKRQSQEQRRNCNTLSQDRHRKAHEDDKSTCSVEVAKSTGKRQSQYLSLEENISKHKKRIKIYRSMVEVQENHKAKEKIRLSDPEQRKVHQNRDSDAHKRRLIVPEERETHRVRDRDAHKRRLLDSEEREKHRFEDRESHKKRLLDPEEREKHRVKDREAHKKRLLDPEEREKHRLKDREAHKERLLDPQERKIHQVRDREVHKKRMLDPEEREKHRLKDLKAHKERLLDPQERKIHQVRDREVHKKRMLDPEEREKHRLKDREAHKERLLDPQERKIHQVRDREVHKKRMLDLEERERHQVKDREAHKERRLDPEQKENHRVKDREAHKERRLDPEEREKHRVKDREAHKERLLDPKEREIHRFRLRESQKERLLEPDQRELHRLRLQISQEKRLSDPKSKIIHLKRLQDSQKKRLYEPSQRKLHISRVTESRRARVEETEHQRRNTLFAKFDSLKKEGPTYECASCCRLWFKTSVKFLKVEGLRCTLEFLEATCKMLDSATVGYVCSTCEKAIKNNKVPTLSMSNKELIFPVIPSEIMKLSDLEERFLCPRIPFMTIRAVVGDQQYVVKGRAVNVPTDVENSVSVLPRVSSEAMVIPICFRRKKSYKSNVMFENVRPKVIQEAGIVLESSPIYLHCGIKLDCSRIAKIPALQPTHTDDILDSDSSDNSSEDEEPINIEDEATLLLTEAMIFAPGEGRKPVSLFDEYAEALSFIKIYGGQLIKQPKGMTYQNWIKSEIMRGDRRCANVTKLFFSALKLRASKIAGNITFCLRKAKTRSKLTVQDMLDENIVKNIELHDSGFKVFATDRGAPAYWEERKKEVFAMIRQLGPPSIFLTMSPAESRWPELMVILKKVVDGETISLEQAKTLEYKEKARLIRTDPVTLARYFEYRMRQFFIILKEKNSIFREYSLMDFYIRTEFQQRGSPHCHCLLWLHNAPKYSEEDTDHSTVTTFIDRFISCSNQISQELLELQTHKHTFTCRKGLKKTKCRFDIPFFPLYETSILLPLKDVVKPELTEMRQQRQQIQDFLANAHKNKVAVTIEELLNTFQLTYSTYIKTIRSGLSRPTVMLRRKPDECMTNFYNEEILKLHLANMDIQFITDMYSCATYVLNYLNKSSRGLSKLLNDAITEVRNGNYTMKEQLRALANQFLKASEFSAQEAVYYILALPLSRSSRQCTFINTSPPEKRVAVVKSKKNLEALPANSSDIYVRNIIDHYAHRPNELEDTCLASLVAHYTFSSTNRKANNAALTSEEDTEEEEENVEEHDVLKLNDASGYLNRRKKSRIIRFVHFNEHTHYEDFIRENVMLFVPWRDESDMIRSSNNLFTTHKDLIKHNRAEYIFNEDIENILQEAVAQQNENSDSDDELHTPPNLAVFCDFSQEGDIAVDMNDGARTDAATNKQDVYFPVPCMISEEEYANLVCTLNEKQRAFLLHVLHCYKLGLLPLYHCVLGGAGVGKSRLIEAIQQALLRLINAKATNLDSLKVLLCAPTGKAAFGIKGTTLHAAFVLPLNQCSADLVPLSNSTRNTLLTKLRDISLIIIDEISMVGSRIIQQVDCRLKQVFQSSKPFAGISVIVFGDFNQLAPVGDRYIFESHASDPYGVIVGNPIWRLFTSFQLVEIMRQRNDVQFAEALNNVASGSLVPEQVRLLESRVVNDPNTIPRESIRLFRSNAEVDSFNKKVIEEDLERQTVEANDKVTGKASEVMKQRLLETAKSSAAKDTQGLPFQLALSFGIKYMLTVNVDVEDGLVNGAVGVLKGYDLNSQRDVTRLWLEFSDYHVGKKRRREVRKEGEDNWTAIDKVNRNIRPTKSVVYIIRQQFPVVPAEAITIYKSQGGTYDSVAVQLTRGLRRNELYVALSRCTKLSGLYLLGTLKPPSPPSLYDKVQMEIKRILNTALTTACYFPNNFSGQDTIVYQNIQSLLETSHWRDFNNYVKLQKPCVFIAAETWINAEDNINVPNYNIAHRIDVESNHKRHAYGLTVYCRMDQHFTIVFNHSEERTSKACCLVTGLYKDIAVCTGYKPPSTPYNAVQQQIEEMITVAKRERNKIIVLGDFNIDLKKEYSHSFFHMLKSNGFSEKKLHGEGYTTNANTAIDVIFANFNFFCGVSETLFGHHKQLLCVPEAPQCDVGDTDQRQDFSSVHEAGQFSLLEAIEEGKWLQKKIRRLGTLDNNDIVVTRKLCSFLRQGVHKTTPRNQNHDVCIPDFLKPYFTPIKTTGDGNCFYYAVSLLLIGKESLMCCLRALEAAHIIANETFLDNLPLSLGATISMSNVLRDRTYAEFGDVLLTSLILHRPINVYTDSDISSTRFAPITSRDELHLYLDIRGHHYTAMVPKIKEVPLPTLLSIPDLDVSAFTQPCVQSIDKGNAHVPVPKANELSFSELACKGKCLLNKIQQTRRVDNNNIRIARKICTSLRNRMHRGQFRSAGDVRMPTSLEPYFTPIKTTGDGNCFYYAVSLLLSGKESLMPCLRAVEAACIITNKDFLDNLLLGLGAEITLDHVLQDGTYAEFGDVLCISLILQRPINIYTDSDISSMRFAPFPSHNELHLYLDMRGQHYTAMVPKTKDIPLPPLVRITDMDILDFTSFQ